MSDSLRFRSSPPDVSFLVCESGRRWLDAARRFVGPFQHAPRPASGTHRAGSGEPRFSVQAVEHSKVRAMIAGRPSVAILWEISLENASSTALTIAQIGVNRSDIFQLITIREDSGTEANRLSLRMMEFGIAANVPSPEQFGRIAKLVRRRFSCPAVDGIETVN